MNAMGMNWIRQSRRLALYERDNFQCVYCGERAPDVKLCLDHVNPRTKGGVLGKANGSSNLVTACRTCNDHKAEKPLGRWVRSEFKNHAYVMSRIHRQVALPVDLNHARILLRSYGTAKNATEHLNR